MFLGTNPTKFAPIKFTCNMVKNARCNLFIYANTWFASYMAIVCASWGEVSSHLLQENIPQFSREGLRILWAELK